MAEEGLYRRMESLLRCYVKPLVAKGLDLSRIRGGFSSLHALPREVLALGNSLAYFVLFGLSSL